MTVRLKALVFTTLAMGGLIAILYVSSRLIILGSFSRLEHQTIVRNMTRARYAVLKEIEEVDRNCGDWAPWDDTYAFIQDGNPAYVKGNLEDSTFSNLRLSLAAFVDTSGKTVYITGFDLKRGVKTAPPKGLLPYLAPGSPLLKHKDNKSSHSGVLVLPEGAMLVSSRPILTSQWEGPMRGSLVFGRDLDIERLSEMTRLTLLAHQVNRRHPPAHLREMVEDLRERTQVRQTAGANVAFGYTLLRDEYGDGAILLELKQPRDIYRQGEVTLRYLLACLLVLGTISLFVVYLLMEKAVLMRLGRLATDVRKIGQAKHRGARVALPGQDELSGLAAAINEMLAALEEAEQTIRHQACHDPLTNLPNRAFFYDRLAEAIVGTQQPEHLLAVLFLDLDNFKAVNDTLGHHVGDELLREVGHRLRRSLRADDMVGRVGGDEFAVLLPRIQQAEDAAVVAEKILAVLRSPVQVAGQELPTCASIGISLYPKDGMEVQSLLRNADLALYRAKEEGKNTFRFYSPQWNTRLLARRALASSLQEAVRREELELHYQPRVCLRDGSIIGAEVLLRWRHRDLGVLYPGQFLPLAEESGEIAAIGEWVIREACAQARRWEDEGEQSLGIAVNLSLGQWRDASLLDTVQAALADSGLPPHLLELEITEPTVLHDLELSNRLTQQLKQVGVRLCVEDVMTHQASHSYLARLSVDAVKIDRFCLRSLISDPEGAKAAAGVIAAARGLGLSVVAEGVETEEQVAFLLVHGCEAAQGYLFSKPRPPEEITQLLQREAGRKGALAAKL